MALPKKSAKFSVGEIVEVYVGGSTYLTAMVARVKHWPATERYTYDVLYEKTNQYGMELSEINLYKTSQG